jgi:hypothetical protein
MSGSTENWKTRIPKHELYFWKISHCLFPLVATLIFIGTIYSFALSDKDLYHEITAEDSNDKGYSSQHSLLLNEEGLYVTGTIIQISNFLILSIYFRLSFSDRLRLLYDINRQQYPEKFFVSNAISVGLGFVSMFVSFMYVIFLSALGNCALDPTLLSCKSIKVLQHPIMRVNAFITILIIDIPITCFICFVIYGVVRILRFMCMPESGEQDREKSEHHLGDVEIGRVSHSARV